MFVRKQASEKARARTENPDRNEEDKEQYGTFRISVGGFRRPLIITGHHDLRRFHVVAVGILRSVLPRFQGKCLLFGRIFKLNEGRTLAHIHIDIAGAHGDHLGAFVHFVPFRSDISPDVIGRERHRIFLIDIIYGQPELALVGIQAVLSPFLIAVIDIGIFNDTYNRTFHITDP